MSCADMFWHWEHDEKMSSDVFEIHRSESVSFYLMLIEIKVEITS